MLLLRRSISLPTWPMHALTQTGCFSTTTAGPWEGSSGAASKPLHVPFSITPDQAKARFLEWQHGNRLTPGDVLAPGTFTIHPVMLPFWLVHAAVDVQYMGSVQVMQAGRASWVDTAWQESGLQEHPWNQAGMQICGSFQYRRDFMAPLTAGSVLQQLQPLGSSELEAGAVLGAGVGNPPVPLQSPEMRRAMAWEFALLAIREKETAAALERLQAEHGPDQVRNVRVQLTTLSRRLQLGYFPAYEIDYVYGETLNVHGERRPERFQAVVSGAVPAERGGVAGERHFSAQRASLVAGGGFALLASGVAALLAPVAAVDPFRVLTMEGAFSVFLVGSLAAVGARMLPTLLHQHAEEQRMAVEDAELERVVALGMGPLDSGREDQEILRSSLEWRRWQESDKRSWQWEKRRNWAEELWQAQYRRRKERVRLIERLQQQEAQQQAEEEREQRRQRKWGRSAHRSHFKHNTFAGGSRAGGRRDHLGYYKVLGLEVAQGKTTVSQEDIKRAFRRAALRWHPDKHPDERSKRDARTRFHLIRAAYDTLKDPERRGAYDRGEATDHER